MKVTESKEELLGSSGSLQQSQQDLRGEPVEHVLTPQEKTFLLHAERGDCATVRRLLEEYHPEHREVLDIDCVDPLNRSALIAAIENENIELIKILLDAGIKVKDALLHSIKEEYVEAVEMLLQWEEENHVPGEPYSWEAVDRSCSTFTPDITPLILAAHRNHYEILKILLDRGATLPMPHDVRCACDDCVESSAKDSLRHSQARINAYRALTAPSLIALSSPDPVLTAFQLSWELRRLSRMETEFRVEYNELRAQCSEFATALLDHARTSNELEIMLNYNPLDNDIWDPGERQTLDRLKLAIKYKQKLFVAHPNVQQLLAAIWYDGLPGFRRKAMAGQMIQVFKLGAMFPIYSAIYMMAPNTIWGQFMKKPFVKFICHSSSYLFFLTLLGLASQRAEYLVLEWFGTPWMLSILEGWKRRERGCLPGIIESCVILYIISLIWAEIRALWSGGLLEYISDLWNIVDFITNVFYIAWIGLRFTAWFIVQRDAWRGIDPWYPREKWDPFDPMLLSEGAFAAGMIFSFLKLVHIFSINPHLGPLQVSLGRMIIDIIKFFFIYSLVLFAFGCGLNQLMWYYADLEKEKCYHLPSGLPDFENQEKACGIWRRYANLFETSQSLFWASFGLVDLETFDLTGIKSFTRFWGLLMFGSYSVINVIVLLNMLIAMMSNSYQIISERSDTEWKFARTNLWMSYFEDGDTVPPPFNLIPTPKNMLNLFKCEHNKRTNNSIMRKSHEKAKVRHMDVMRQLIRRYVTAEQRKRDEYGISEDDVMEIRQDISTLRYELIDILHNNGMKTPRVDPQETQVPGKKGRVMERRLLKDFQIGIVEGIVSEVLSMEPEPKDVFSHIAKAIGSRSSGTGKKRDWNALVRKNTVKGDPIGTKSEAMLRRSRQSLRQHIIENIETQTIDPDKLIEYNPKLSEVTPVTRVAYAKFMKKKFQSDYILKEEKIQRGSTSSLRIEDEVFAAGTVTPVLKLKSRTSSTGSADNVFETEPATVAETSPEYPEHTPVEKDFRSRTPIQEVPDEEVESRRDSRDMGVPKSVEDQKDNELEIGTALGQLDAESQLREPSITSGGSSRLPSPPPVSRGPSSPIPQTTEVVRSEATTSPEPPSKVDTPQPTEDIAEQDTELPPTEVQVTVTSSEEPPASPKVSPPTPPTGSSEESADTVVAPATSQPASVSVETPSISVTPTTSLLPCKGKSKATGRNLTGWI